MTRVSLNFYQRISLWNLIGNHEAPNLREAATYLRLIEKLRPTDEEALRTQFVLDNGRCAWQLPGPDYGNRTIDLEQTEAQALAQAIECIKPVRIVDAGWMLQLVDQLTKSPSEVTP